MSITPNDGAGDEILTTHFLNSDDPIPDYRNNALIGALGPILDKDARFALMHREATYDESMRRLPPHLLAHAVRRLSTMFIPLAEHDAAVAEAEIVIRQSYIHRNPLNRMRRRQEFRDRQQLKGGTAPAERYSETPLLGQLITGCVGTGKTTIANVIMSMWQQVVRHAYEVDGVTVAFTQVVYIRIVLFHDASLKAFAQEFFSALAAALGDPTILTTWKVDRCSAANAAILIYAAVLEYRVGAIIVDDSQNVEYHVKSPDVVLSYFVRLMNTMGVAVILVGTDTTKTLISKDDTFARRFVCETPVFNALRPGDAAGVFDAFVDQVWSKQLTVARTDYQKLKPLIYSTTGGVPDLIVKLFVLCQSRVFGRKNDVIDEPVIKEVADKLFSVVADRVEEIKGRVKAGAELAEQQSKLHRRALELIDLMFKERGQPPPFATPVVPPVDIAPPSVNDSAATPSPIEVDKPKSPATKVDPRAALTALGAFKA